MVQLATHEVSVHLLYDTVYLGGGYFDGSYPRRFARNIPTIPARNG